MSEKKIKGGSFQTLGLDAQLMRNIPFNNPTPIQRMTIPMAMEERSIMAIARTGSGKTLCYLLPAIQKAINGGNSLILLPTKELVLQVKRICKMLSTKLTLKGKIEITTLRKMEISDLSLLVVDEIDRILEEKSLSLHFQGIVEQINCQRLYFSATLPNEPLDIKVVQIENKIPTTIAHTFLYVPTESKESALINIMDREKKTIIFTATKYGVDFLLKALAKYDYEAKGIYSSMDDDARRYNFDKFLSGKVKILVVTDVAARGIDIPHLDVSISYDLSDEKTFVHRVGRVRGMGEQYSLVTYTDVFHFFNIKETHLPDVEIGTVPQNILDAYDFSDLLLLKQSAMRGYQRCLDFRRKVSCPSEFKGLISSFDIHSRYKQEETLASRLKKINAPKPVTVKNEPQQKDYKDQFFIPYSKRDLKTHSSAFAVSKDDYVRESKPRERSFKPKFTKRVKKST
ncbi:ATP-dependent RNA helicase DDX54/DBP10 [Enteropsectra breve]|nr:ATP-dependent RNA helicase DDX54/DBP10 [Enteropsectra breve]